MQTMKFLLISTLFVFSFLNAQEQTIYDFTVNDIEGNEYPLAQLKGKKVMLVNTASKCGLTPQYEGLQALYEKYKDENFVIVGFPANNFMSQEPGEDDEIAAFCEKNYGVTFPMMSKISVKGKDMHQLYKFLTTKEINQHSDNKVAWNFQKYLINEEGELEQVISPREDPQSETIINWIKE